MHVSKFPRIIKSVSHARNWMNIHDRINTTCRFENCLKSIKGTFKSLPLWVFCSRAIKRKGCLNNIRGCNIFALFSFYYIYIVVMLFWFDNVLTKKWRIWKQPRGVARKKYRWKHTWTHNMSLHPKWKNDWIGTSCCHVHKTL